MGIEREEPSKCVFDSHLREVFGLTDYVWFPGPDRNHPPDRYLMLAGVRYAVEMTSTRVLRESENGKSVPLETYLNSFERVVKEIADIARSRDTVTGFYNVHATRPLNNLRKVKAKLIAKALDYIEMTREVLRADECYLLGEDDDFSVEIAKYGLSPVGVFPTTSEAEWEGTATEIVRGLIRTTLIEKCEKLANENVSEPAILLIVNAYPHAYLPKHFELARTLPELTDYHSVYIVLNHKSGFFLHSRFANWSNSELVGKELS